ncbi:MAG: CDP-glycerol glycerophosphotransferase family protein, partial [Bacilli bacterium]
TIQLWHATGAIKKFGINIKRLYEIKPYDYVFVGANCFINSFAKAFNMNENAIKVLGVSKTDYLFNKTFIQEKMLYIKDKYHLGTKRIILYAPTFRGEGFSDMNYDEEKIEEILSLLSENDCLLVKLHPLINKQATLDNRIINVTSEDLYSLLCASDLVISDYSALVFDALILKKPTILYLYDYHEYLRNRGLSFELDQYQIPTAYHLLELSNLINEEPIVQDYEFLQQFDGNSTSRIVSFIINQTKR